MKTSVLRDRRLALGLTLRDMAEALGWSVAFVSDLELGRRNTRDVERLAKGYQLSPLTLCSALGICCACKGTGKT